MKRFLMMLPALLLLVGCAGQKAGKRSIEALSQGTGAAMSSYPTKAAPVPADKALISNSESANATNQTALSFALTGDCTGFPCLDGSPDGGNYIKLWAGTGTYWTALQGGAPTANRSWRLPIAAAPAAGETLVMTMDQYGQMGFLAKPSTSGYMLSSTDAGVLSWVDPLANADDTVVTFPLCAVSADGTTTWSLCSTGLDAGESPRWSGSAWEYVTAGILDDTKGNGDTGYTWSADKIFDQLALKAPAIAIEVDGSTDVSLTAAQVSGTIVTNRGQAAADVALTLPTAAAGYNALFTVGTAQSNKWGVRAGTNDKIYLLAADGTVSAGSDNGYARMTAAQVGQVFACWTFQTGSSAWDWQCKAGAIGTSTFAAN